MSDILSLSEKTSLVLRTDEDDIYDTDASVIIKETQALGPQDILDLFRVLTDERYEVLFVLMSQNALRLFAQGDSVHIFGSFKDTDYEDSGTLFGKRLSVTRRDHVVDVFDDQGVLRWVRVLAFTDPRIGKVACLKIRAQEQFERPSAPVSNLLGCGATPILNQ
mgnify:CR=1 FL=1